jgi:hypothetical protein
MLSLLEFFKEIWPVGGAFQFHHQDLTTTSMVSSIFGTNRVLIFKLCPKDPLFTVPTFKDFLKAADYAAKEAAEIVIYYF